MPKSQFIYISYIRTTPKKLWRALTNPQCLSQYWFGMSHKTDWKKGSPWQIIFPDGTVADTGEIIESKPSKRLVIKWRNEFMPALKSEGYSRCTMQIARERGVVKFTVAHEIPRQKSKFIEAVSCGWPMILSNLKSLLETGDAIMKKKPAKK